MVERQSSRAERKLPGPWTLSSVFLVFGPLKLKRSIALCTFCCELTGDLQMQVNHQLKVTRPSALTQTVKIAVTVDMN